MILSNLLVQLLEVKELLRSSRFSRFRCSEPEHCTNVLLRFLIKSNTSLVSGVLSLVKIRPRLVLPVLVRRFGDGVDLSSFSDQSISDSKRISL